MFKHSTKVPRLYKVSAKIAKDVKEGIGSIKNLVYEHRKKHPNVKAMYALVATLFQKHDELESLLKKSQFFTKEPRADPWLTKILLVELLWGKKRLAGDSTPEKTIQAYEQIFKAHLTNPPIISEKDDNQVSGDIKPRYVRINTLFMSLDEAIEGFRNEGWQLCKFFDKTDYDSFLRKITSLEDEFLIDIHVPNLLIFPHKTEFYKHPAYQNGSIILQDKASCLPVHILNPPPGSVVLDMCAAPGMKTTQLAAVMNNEGTIYAVERNPKRFETLNKIIEASKATCIKTENKDVLTCTAADFPEVEYILVDPSCSGSGMTDRLEHEQKADAERIRNLAGFQIKILRSALTRYPKVKRVVYSTCSMYPEENEDVVRQVLETNTRFKLVPAKQYVNDTWQNFGSSDFGEIGSYCLYAKRNEDFTNGFFVAIFEKLQEGEENHFFNTKVYNYKRHVQGQENRRKRKQEALDDNAGKNVELKEEKGKLAEERIFEDNSRDQKLSIKREHFEGNGLEGETKKEKSDVFISEDLIDNKHDVKKERSEKKSKRDSNLTNEYKENTIKNENSNGVCENDNTKSLQLTTKRQKDKLIKVEDNRNEDQKKHSKEEYIEGNEREVQVKKKKKKVKDVCLGEGEKVEGIEIKKEKKEKIETCINEDLIENKTDVKEKSKKKKSKTDSSLTMDGTEEIVENEKTEKHQKSSKSFSLEDQPDVKLTKQKKKRDEYISNESTPKIKKKKQEDNILVDEVISGNDFEEKRKKKKSKRLENEMENNTEQPELLLKSRKIKNYKEEYNSSLLIESKETKSNSVAVDTDTVDIEDSKKKRSRKKEKEDLEIQNSDFKVKIKHRELLPSKDIENEVDVKRKKKKKSLECEESTYEVAKSDEVPLEIIAKKKKKHKKLDSDL